jgi:hypothetical protein
MNCQKFESIVSELARSQIMEVANRGEALAHSSECASCRLRLRNEEMLTRGLRALALETESARAPNRIEQQLLVAFRERKVLHFASLTKSRRPYWLAAAAAVLLIVASVAAVRWRTEKPATQTTGQTAGDNRKSVPEKLVGDDSPKPAPENQKAPALAPKPKRNARNVIAKLRPLDASGKTTELAANSMANESAREIATEFIPLGYLNAVIFQDGGQIVRVQLPRSAMASFGLPVNMERYNERVKADVLLGVDGVAQAIRFVQ